MRSIKIVVVIMLGILSFSACEKDDICIDADTPLLVIRFYDIDNPTEIKKVNSLRIIGSEQSTPTNSGIDRTEIDSIGIPLRIDATTTGFTLIADSVDEEDVDTGNKDALEFSYIVSEVFKSRACGFIVNYSSLTNSLTTDTDNWIKNIEIVTDTIDNSAAAHVKIFH